jgi:hypothetical protein
MAGKLLPDDDFTEGALVEALKQMLVDTPDDVFIGQVWDGDELRAFVIAFAPPSMRHVFVHQAWADPTLEGSKTQDKLFLRLCLWAESIERRELRAETRRNPEAFLRRWNFVEYSKVLSFNLGEDLTDLLNVAHDAVIQKEPGDGKELSSTANITSTDAGVEQVSPVRVSDSIKGVASPEG